MTPRTAGLEAEAALLRSQSAAHAEGRLCPEIRLNLPSQVWASFQDGFDNGLLTPPYWALEWPGGQALARHILDHPDIVAGRTVVDWGTGCGLVAIAAALAGARLVRAIDSDSRSIEAVRKNAHLNGVAREVLAIRAELPSPAGGEGDVILAADLWYDRFEARRITASLRSFAKRGLRVLVADADRAFTPRYHLTTLSLYSIATDPDIEQKRLTTAYVALLEGRCMRETFEGGSNGR
jgi:predicted nicotinamide N-methyase